MHAGIGMKIAFVTSEVWPLSKTGGLADYSYSLPKALSEMGHQVDVYTPSYSPVDGEGGEVAVNGMVFTAARETIAGWTAVKLWNRELFGRGKAYGYEDDFRRFGYFAAAAAEALSGGGYDVVHCNDWQSGYIPLLLKGKGCRAKTIFAIHNLEFQGSSDPVILDEIGIDRGNFHMEGVEFYGQASSLKSGIVFADSVVTVSPTYAKEIQTPEFGFGMEGVIRKHSGKLSGILNGIDYGIWDPSTDAETRAHFSDAALQGKGECKSALQREFSLPQVRRPVISFIGRLWRQKGMDILLDALPLIKGGYQLIVLGTGDEQLMKRIERTALHNMSCRAILRYDEKLSHRIYAGSDIFVMPSRFEPCGLGHMISMRYGTVPVVRRTGGLADTVTEYGEAGEGNGFLFDGEGPAELADALNRAIALYSDQTKWRSLVTKCMSEDWSWGASGRRYAELYGSLLS